MQTAVDRATPLARPATLCRWENRADRAVAWAILALLVKRLRQAWPAVRLILRGDSGVCPRATAG